MVLCSDAALGLARLRRNCDGAVEICGTSVAGAGVDGRESALDIAIGTVQHNAQE